MREIQLTHGLFALVDDDDFERVNNLRWYAKKSRQTWYAVCSRKLEGWPNHARMHRFILGINNKKIIIDHKDRNGLNNQKPNLRTCSYSQNSGNMVRTHKTKSPYKGVTFRKDTKRWTAQIMHNYRHISLGCYPTEKEAAIAYNEGAIKIFGEFAKINHL